MIKGSIQENIMFIDIYAHKLGESKYIKQILTDIKGEVDKNTIIIGGFNTPLTSMDRSSKQKVNEETVTLYNTLDQLELMGLYRTFHPKTAEYTFFASVHGTFSRMDHMLGYK